MSRRRIPGRGRMPEQWEWSCDYCGKTAHTNSQTTRPAGWVPRGRMAKDQRDFCSEEHEAEYRKSAEPAEAETPEAKAAAEPVPNGSATTTPAEPSSSEAPAAPS